jgi:hypothetical protein
MKLKVLSLMLLFSAIVNRSYASHVAGAELYYCSLDSVSYVVTFVYYHNCGSLVNPNPGPVPASVIIRINSALLSTQLVHSIPLLPPPNGTDVTQICSSFPQTTCDTSISPYQGFAQWVYQDTITLPAQSTDWVLSCDITARADGITNIYQVSSSSLYVEATLDNVTAVSDCSPVFSNPSIFYACIGQLNTWNYSATDADGDSLVYSLDTARKVVASVVTPLTYLSPFSPTNPLTTLTVFSLNAGTGIISFTPTLYESTIICIRVDEYRNGIWIGSIVRDHMLLTTFYAGVEEYTSKNSVYLFPNPATSELTIENEKLKIEVIEILNVPGEKVFEKHLTSNVQRLTINVADFPSGIYFVKVKTEQGISMAKFVKE